MKQLAKSTNASIRNLETQIEQLSKQLATKYTNNHEENIIENLEKNKRCYDVSCMWSMFVNIVRPEHYRKSSARKIELGSDCEEKKRKHVVGIVEKGEKFGKEKSYYTSQDIFISTS